MTSDEFAADAEMLAHTLQFVDEWFVSDPGARCSAAIMRMVIARALAAHEVTD